MRIRLKIPFHVAKLLIYIFQIYQKYMLKNMFSSLLLYAIEIQKVMVMQTIVLVFRNVSKKVSIASYILKTTIPTTCAAINLLPRSRGRLN
jgi:hypothetical protein